MGEIWGEVSREKLCLRAAGEAEEMERELTIEDKKCEDTMSNFAICHLEL